jgi:hypothetical protein
LPRRVSKPAGSVGQIAGVRSPASGSQSDSRKTRTAPDLAAIPDSGASNNRPHPSFELPQNFRVHPVKQTLLQPDVPPDVLLKHEVPLPNVVFWTPEAPTPFRKRFVAPPVKAVAVKVTQRVLPTPDLPNRESAVSDLKLAALLAPESARLVRPPATTSPVRIPGSELIDQVPQVVLPESNPASASALVALTDSPSRPNGMVIVPPANQISNSDPSGSLGEASGAGSGHKGTGQGGQLHSAGSEGTGDGPAKSAGAGAKSGGANAGLRGLGDSGGSTGVGSGAAVGGQSAGSTTVGAGLSSAESGVGSATAGAGDEDNGLSQIPANVTRIALPKDGKFGVVVTGSSQATPYPETIGALSGKMVYTVYLSVGLHKKWIMQYCLTREAARQIPRGSGTPLEAPWPILVFRPDHLAQPGDYVVVHGLIDAEGRFKQLVMVFPDQFDQKDLLINSLKLWSFRPASRDRAPTAVEVLLIIPAES